MVIKIFFVEQILLILATYQYAIDPSQTAKRHLKDVSKMSYEDTQDI